MRCLYFVAAIGLGAIAEAQVPEPPAVATELQTEPLLRGPIHEAYAEPLVNPEEDPFVAPLEPPPPVEEVPPQIDADDPSMTWIDGYWSWDDERQDFIWISGVWRKSPPNRDWVAGQWQPVEGGYRWIPGRWVPSGVADVESIPLPPPSLEQGATSEPPADDQFWVPGAWQYRANRYAWRPGFWSACYDDWVWVPDSYYPAATGCAYVPGYWDYPWERRGVLYAPCYFDRRSAYFAGGYYSPSVVLNVSSAFFHLWVRPGYGHYYFGDYYGAGYSGFGFVPWYSYHSGYRRGGYDPLFAHYNRRFRHDNVDLHRHFRNQHQFYERNVAARPGHHLEAERYGAGHGGVRGVGSPIAGTHSVLAYRAGDRRGIETGVQRREQLRANVLREHREQVRAGLADSTLPARDSRVVVGNRHTGRAGFSAGTGSRGSLGAGGQRSLSTRRAPDTQPGADGARNRVRAQLADQAPSRDNPAREQDRRPAREQNRRIVTNRPATDSGVAGRVRAETADPRQQFERRARRDSAVESSPLRGERRRARGNRMRETSLSDACPRWIARQRVGNRRFRECLLDRTPS